MIYYLHDDPAICAQMLDDRSLDKQIKAIARALCSVHHKLLNIKETKINKEATEGKHFIIPSSCYWNTRHAGIPLPHQDHCEFSDWASECLANYKTLVDMGLACCEEYSWRFSSYLLETQHPKEVKHKLQPVIKWARDNNPFG